MFPDKAKMAVNQNDLKDLTISNHREVEWNCIIRKCWMSCLFWKNSASWRE